MNEQFTIEFNKVMDLIEKESEEFWNSLSKDDQLKVFCAVSRRIYKGEIEEQGSYRHVLYDTFDFGPEAYAPAQLAHYLEIHNAIYASDHDIKLLQAFCRKNDLDENLANNFLNSPNVPA